MRTVVRMGTAALTAALLSGCMVQDKYHWGSYEQDLLTYYRDSDKGTILVENLSETITKGEEKGLVPPGIYAEYGYLLLESGNAKDSILYFKKERDAWPESATLMQAMIKVAEAEVKKQ
ncbi:hypothetical protein WH96_11495 [Kiloniella spongiae]|uniref:Lipoprotein n=1 Tax=Kiloniella spongiae TaxID=1489064 RepID=A0A0H2MHY9_9PROT|nr:DUF4810 domain-containing protein [Kiloniella spongiae]KLN60372.1 hypothetical protein WH96_11495 [Kiloniella spongiae]